MAARTVLCQPSPLCIAWPVVATVMLRIPLKMTDDSGRG